MWILKKRKIHKDRIEKIKILTELDIMSIQAIAKITEILTKYFYLTRDFYCDEKSNVLRFELIQ